MGNPNTAARERVSALVDPGYIFAMLPADMLHRPGIAPTRTRRRLADGQAAEYQIGTVYLEIEVDGIDGDAMAVFGPEGVYLSGATTPLDTLLFVLDPINRRLVPDCGLLMRGGIAARRPAAVSGEREFVDGYGTAGR